MYTALCVTVCHKFALYKVERKNHGLYNYMSRGHIEHYI